MVTMLKFNKMKLNKMKHKISKLIIGDYIRYTLQTKKHWWNKWHFLMDGKMPRLFTGEELARLGIVKLPDEIAVKIHTFDKDYIDRLVGIQMDKWFRDKCDPNIKEDD